MRSVDQLFQCFPSLSKVEPDALKRAHQQIQQFVTDNVMKEFRQHNADRQLSELLQTIDSAKTAVTSGTEENAETESSTAAEVKEQKQFDPATEPNPLPQPAEELRRTVLAKQKQDHIQHLHSLLQQEQQDMDSLNSAVQARMHEFNALKRQMNDIERFGLAQATKVFDGQKWVEGVQSDIENYTSMLR